MSITPEVTAKTLSQRVATQIKVQLVLVDMRQSDLARRIGKNEQWLSVRLRGIQPIDLDDLALIADALGVTVLDLIRRAEGDGEPNVRLDQPTPFGPQRRDPSRPPGTTGPRQRRPQPIRHAA